MKLFITLLLLVIPYYTSKEATPTIVVEEYIPIIYLEETTVSVSKHDIVTDTALLVPAFKSQVILFLEDCKKQGIKLYIIETWRTPERQDSLKKKGRSTLSGGHSKHQHCLAIDVVPLEGKKFKWKDKKLWSRIGKIGKKYGLGWGGDWKNFVDYPHFEYKAPCEQKK